MNFKIKNRKLLNGDIISPEIVYAEFSDQIIDGQAENIVNALNHGHDMLMIYKEMRDNLHISNVVEMLSRLESAYAKWDARDFQIRRGVK
jgi:hypothetical protein